MLSRASRLTASIVTAYFVLDALDDYKRLSGVLFWRNLLKSKDRAKIVKQICKTAILRMRTRAEQSTGLNEPTADAGTDGGETSDAAPRRARQGRLKTDLNRRTVGTKTCQGFSASRLYFIILAASEETSDLRQHFRLAFSFQAVVQVV